MLISEEHSFFLFQIQKVLDRKDDGEPMKSIEAHDIICHIADAVLSGGIRRAALISLFDLDDKEKALYMKRIILTGMSEIEFKEKRKVANSPVIKSIIKSNSSHQSVLKELEKLETHQVSMKSSVC